MIQQPLITNSPYKSGLAESSTDIQSKATGIDVPGSLHNTNQDPFISKQSTLFGGARI